MSLKAQTLTVVKFKDKQLPKNLMEAIVADYQSGFGAACAEDGEIQVIQSTDAMTMDMFQKWNENFKDVSLLMSFTKADQPLNQADVQPFIVLRDAKDQIACVASIVGDFTTAEDDDNKERSTLGLGVEDLVIPDLVGVFTECEGNLDAFFKKISDPSVGKHVLSATKKGWITFLGSNGHFQSMIKGDLEVGKLKDQPWGWASFNVLLPKHVPADDKPAAVSAPPSPPPARKKRDFGAPPTDMPAPTGPVNVTNKQPDTAIPPPKETIEEPGSALEQGFSIENGELFFQCPDGPGFNTNAQVRAAYEKYGCIEKGSQEPYKSRPKLKVKSASTLARFEHLLQAAPSQVGEAGAVPDVVDTAVPRVITADEKKKLSALILADDAALKSMDNKDLVPEQELESELPSFVEATGLGEDYGVLSTMRFTDAFLLKLQENCPIAFRQLLKDWRYFGLQQAHRVRQLENRIKELDKPAEQKPAATVTDTTAPKKTKRQFA